MGGVERTSWGGNPMCRAHTLHLFPAIHTLAAHSPNQNGALLGPNSTARFTEIAATFYLHCTCSPPSQRQWDISVGVYFWCL